MKFPTLLLLGLALCLLPACGGEDDTTPSAAPHAVEGGTTPPSGVGPDADLAARIEAAQAKGRAFLLSQQGEGGAFGDTQSEVPGNVSYTAMAVSALVAASPAGPAADDAAIRSALTFLSGFKQEDGSIVDDPRITNYCTSAAVAALAAARVPEFAKLQAEAAGYLRASQIQADAGDVSYGGFPYKQHLGQSADASNALMATSALDADGLPADSPVRARVRAFATRLQNHSESNTAEIEIEVDGQKRVVVAGVDGGGFYRVGESKAGMVKRSDGRWELRSYGSMTYAVLKLLLFAGVDADDARIQALVRWIASNWTVERNPGFEGADDPQKAGQQGYFYYLYSVAHALAAYERQMKAPLVVKDADGRTHDWRSEVARALLARQAADGSWRNEASTRWEEGSRTLATAFALQTLGHLTGRLR
jgi:squalene-hopene/tetraprenyl-beta-curcumene cyclase